MKHPVVKAAELFARGAHWNQLRKYTGEPYAVHLQEVARTVARVSSDPDMIAAAWLHDVVEDTPVTVEQVATMFGFGVGMMVRGLTDVYTKDSGTGNRETRKRREAERMGVQSPSVKTIKLADMLSNTRSIVEHDPSFAVVYLREKRELLGYLYGGNEGLWNRARKELVRAEKQLGLKEMA